MSQILPKIIVAPSILSCDFSFLANECNKVLEDGADWLHIDVMDYRFVPNLTFGPPVIKTLRKHCKGFFDCHLMIQEPYRWIDDFIKAGANQITYHYESDVGESHQKLCESIRSQGVKVGLAIKPKTQIDETILNLINQGLFDMVLVMTVEPGFGGQSFMSDMMPKVELLRKNFPYLNIQVDGGVTQINSDVVAKAGANVIVSGSGVFGEKDWKQTIQNIRENAEKVFGKE